MPVCSANQCRSSPKKAISRAMPTTTSTRNAPRTTLRTGPMPSPGAAPGAAGAPGVGTDACAALEESAIVPRVYGGGDLGSGFPVTRDGRSRGVLVLERDIESVRVERELLTDRGRIEAEHLRLVHVRS